MKRKADVLQEGRTPVPRPHTIFCPKEVDAKETVTKTFTYVEGVEEGQCWIEHECAKRLQLGHLKPHTRHDREFMPSVEMWDDNQGHCLEVLGIRDWVDFEHGDYRGYEWEGGCETVYLARVNDGKVERGEKCCRHTYTLPKNKAHQGQYLTPQPTKTEKRAKGGERQDQDTPQKA